MTTIRTDVFNKNRSLQTTANTVITPIKHIGRTAAAKDYMGHSQNK